MKCRGIWVARVALSTLLLSLFVGSWSYLLAARRASARSTMPVALPGAPPPSVIGSAAAAPDEGNLGVAYRLVDQLGDAKIDTPSLSDRPVRGLLTSHWRRHHAPFTGLSGDLGRYVQHVGLERRSSAGAKKDARIRANEGASLDEIANHARDIRTFGVGEGSYDQRECIVAPTPATLRFKLRIPKRAKLRLAPAVLGEAEASFSVVFRPSVGGERRVLGTTIVRGPSRRYSDWTIDLEAAGIGNSEGELELLTMAKSREPVLALWGSPVIIAPNASRLPYNVLIVIVDGMRSDAIAASHDPNEDLLRKSAKYPPLDAWFEAIPEVAPELDRLARRGAIWKHAWSAAMWTRPATLSLLTGLRSSHTGLEILELELIGDQRRNFYARRPPLLPLMMRAAGATTTAIVNNMYLSGSVGVGVDFGFEAVVDHRLLALDTRNITHDALQFLTEQGSERFFLLLNYASPHSPYVPPPEHLRAVRAAPNRPRDDGVLNYLGEVHKDDAAIGQVLNKLDELKIRDNTLVIVTADHGETMSAAHDVVAVDVAQGVPSGRFTHLSTMWEEAARVAMIMVLPGKIPSGKRLDARVQITDLMPTILQLEGLPVPPELDGRSLLAELQGIPVDDRPVVIEGRGARSIIDGKYHLVVREPIARRLRRRLEQYERAVELYDLDRDPGERKDIAPQYPDIVAELSARLGRMLSEKPAVHVAPTKQRLHLRFATAGKSRQLEVVLRVRGDSAKVVPIGIEPRAIRVEAEQIRVTTATSPDRGVGFDVELSSGATGLAWQVSLDGMPWPAEHVYAGPLGMLANGLTHGFGSNFDPAQLDSPNLPHVVASEEVGMFVTRDPIADTPELETSAEAQLEAQQAMQAWGYAKRPTPKQAQ